MRATNLFLLIARVPPIIMLSAVVCLALAATILVQNEIQKRDNLLNSERLRLSKKEMTEIVLASRDIPEGSTIQQDALKLESVESSKVPIGALSSCGPALGLQTRVAIKAGDSILSSYLHLEEKAKSFEAKIKPGFRAITFPVDASTGVAGFISPDCHVDILAQSGSGADAKAMPILSDVQVIAVGQSYQKKPGETEAQPTSSVTVAVAPRDAGKLINAMSSGRLYCLLRNQIDHTPLAVRDVSSLFPEKEKDRELEPVISSLPTIPKPNSEPKLPPPVMPQADRQHSVDIWAASKKDELSFPQK
ncbi:MAG: Flp pilus assembly protein CpaB [Candidatus Obscuribacterales bacterium]|nr:Flp pilus assembly protein CpaB [Candidatus Obscuribacterales bacterium]